VKYDPYARLYTMKEIAALMGWHTRRTKRWLVKCGAARCMPNGQWVTSLELLRSNFPEAWQALLLRGPEPEDTE